MSIIDGASKITEEDAPKTPAAEKANESKSVVEGSTSFKPSDLPTPVILKEEPKEPKEPNSYIQDTADTNAFIRHGEKVKSFFSSIVGAEPAAEEDMPSILSSKGPLGRPNAKPLPLTIGGVPMDARSIKAAETGGEVKELPSKGQLGVTWEPNYVDYSYGNRTFKIDSRRPILHTDDGYIMTEHTTTFRGPDGKWWIIPTVVGGEQMSIEEAQRRAEEGKHEVFAKFDRLESAEDYAVSRSAAIGEYLESLGPPQLNAVSETFENPYAPPVNATPDQILGMTTREFTNEDAFIAGMLNSGTSRVTDAVANQAGEDKATSQDMLRWGYEVYGKEQLGIPGQILFIAGSILGDAPLFYAFGTMSGIKAIGGVGKPPRMIPQIGSGITGRQAAAQAAKNIAGTNTARTAAAFGTRHSFIEIGNQLEDVEAGQQVALLNAIESVMLEGLIGTAYGGSFGFGRGMAALKFKAPPKTLTDNVARNAYMSFMQALGFTAVSTGEKAIKGQDISPGETAVEGVVNVGAFGLLNALFMKVPPRNQRFVGRGKTQVAPEGFKPNAKDVTPSDVEAARAHMVRKVVESGQNIPVPVQRRILEEYPHFSIYMYGKGRRGVSEFLTKQLQTIAANRHAAKVVESNKREGEPMHPGELAMYEGEVSNEMPLRSLAALRKDGTVVINEAAAREDFEAGLPYLRGESDLAGSAQKAEVFKRVDLDKLKAQLGTADRYIEFIRLHEEGHKMQIAEGQEYPKDIMSEEAIMMERLANKYALEQMGITVESIRPNTGLDPMLDDPTVKAIDDAYFAPGAADRPGGPASGPTGDKIDYRVVLPRRPTAEPVEPSHPKQPPAPKTGGVRIISGGQTGADTAGLLAAEQFGAETGGTLPKGLRRERDELDVNTFGERFGTKEHQFDTGYRGRTIQNAQEADGTVWFGNPDSPGGKLTLGPKSQRGKPKPLVNPTANQLAKWMTDNNIQTLNVAGNRDAGLKRFGTSRDKVQATVLEALQKHRIASKSKDLPAKGAIDDIPPADPFERYRRIAGPNSKESIQFYEMLAASERKKFKLSQKFAGTLIDNFMRAFVDKNAMVKREFSRLRQNTDDPVMKDLIDSAHARLVLHSGATASATMRFEDHWNYVIAPIAEYGQAGMDALDALTMAHRTISIDKYHERLLPEIAKDIREASKELQELHYLSGNPDAVTKLPSGELENKYSEKIKAKQAELDALKRMQHNMRYFKHPMKTNKDHAIEAVEDLKKKSPKLYTAGVMAMNRYFGMMRHTVRRLHDAGIIDTDTKKRLLDAGLYSPRNLLAVTEGTTGSRVRGAQMSGARLKALEQGTHDLIETDAGELMFRVYLGTEYNIFKNEANKALYELLEYMRVRSISNKIGRVTTKESPDATGVLAEAYYPERKAVELNPEYAQEWIEKDATTPAWVAKTLRTLSLSNVLKRLVTGMDPGFAVPNMTLAMFHVYNTTQQFSSLMPIAFPQLLAKAGILPMRFTGKVMDRAARITPDMLKEWVPEMSEFMSGKIKDLMNSPTIRKTMRELTAQGAGFNFLTDQGIEVTGQSLLQHPGWTKVWRFLSAANVRSESVFYVALYRMAKANALKSGKTEKEARTIAAFVARNHLDFAQRGYVTDIIDMVIPYTNPAVQVTRGVVRASVGQKQIGFDTKHVPEMLPLFGKDKTIPLEELTPRVGADLRFVLKMLNWIGASVLLGIYNKDKEAEKQARPSDKENYFRVAFPDDYFTRDEFGNKIYYYVKIRKDPASGLAGMLTDSWMQIMNGEEPDFKPNEIMPMLMRDFMVITPDKQMPSASMFFAMFGNTDLWRAVSDPGDPRSGLIWKGDPTNPAVESSYFTNELFDRMGMATIGLPPEYQLSPMRMERAVGSLGINTNAYTRAILQGTDIGLKLYDGDQTGSVFHEVMHRFPLINRFIGSTDPTATAREEIGFFNRAVNTERILVNRAYTEMMQKYPLDRPLPHTALNEFTEFARSVDPKYADGLTRRFTWDKVIRLITPDKYELAHDFRAKLQLINRGQYSGESRGSWTFQYWTQLESEAHQKDLEDAIRGVSGSSSRFWQTFEYWKSEFKREFGQEYRGEPGSDNYIEDSQINEYMTGKKSEVLDNTIDLYHTLKDMELGGLQ